MLSFKDSPKLIFWMQIGELYILKAKKFKTTSNVSNQSHLIKNYPLRLILYNITYTILFRILNVRELGAPYLTPKINLKFLSIVYSRTLMILYCSVFEIVK